MRLVVRWSRMPPRLRARTAARTWGVTARETYTNRCVPVSVLVTAVTPSPRTGASLAATCAGSSISVWSAVMSYASTLVASTTPWSSVMAPRSAGSVTLCVRTSAACSA